MSGVVAFAAIGIGSVVDYKQFNIVDDAADQIKKMVNKDVSPATHTNQALTLFFINFELNLDVCGVPDDVVMSLHVGLSPGGRWEGISARWRQLAIADRGRPLGQLHKEQNAHLGLLKKSAAH
jgi:hypothetical protein